MPYQTPGLSGRSKTRSERRGWRNGVARQQVVQTCRFRGLRVACWLQDELESVLLLAPWRPGAASKRYAASQQRAKVGAADETAQTRPREGVRYVDGYGPLRPSALQRINSTGFSPSARLLPLSHARAAASLRANDRIRASETAARRVPPAPTPSYWHQMRVCARSTCATPSRG